MKKIKMFIALLFGSSSLYSMDLVQFNKDMVKAVESGDIKTVKQFIDKCDVNFKTEGRSLLEIACFKGYKPIAALLIKNGAIIADYYMVTVSIQSDLKERLSSLGLNVTSIGTIEYRKNFPKRVLQCKDLFFLRHGNTFATENKIFTDMDTKVSFLSEQGRDEIERTANEIIKSKPDIIVTSPLTRCKESLEIVIKKLESNLQEKIEIKELDFIKGISHGYWEGKNKEGLVGKDLLTWFAKWNSYIFAKSPGGESLAEVLIRANDLLNFIDEKYQSKRVLIIGHGSISWALTVLLKIFTDPSNNDYQIKYGELKKLY